MMQCYSHRSNYVFMDSLIIMALNKKRSTEVHSSTLLLWPSKKRHINHEIYIRPLTFALSCKRPTHRERKIFFRLNLHGHDYHNFSLILDQNWITCLVYHNSSLEFLSLSQGENTQILHRFKKKKNLLGHPCLSTLLCINAWAGMGVGKENPLFLKSRNYVYIIRQHCDKQIGKWKEMAIKVSSFVVYLPSSFKHFILEVHIVLHINCWGLWVNCKL